MLRMRFGRVTCESDVITEDTVLRLTDARGYPTDVEARLSRLVVRIRGEDVVAKADGGPAEFVCRAAPDERARDEEFLSCLASIIERREMRTNEMLLGRFASRLRDALREEGSMLPILTSHIETLVEAADRRRDEIVLCLLGAPGIGKTEGIESFARKHDRNVVHIIASQILPTEVSGMTMPNQETHSMDVFDHSRLSHMRDGDILFLDELLKGQQQVLSACLTLVQERRLMSGTHLPDVIIVAAANPLASAKMLPEEIRQRFLFIDVEFDKGSWCDYMKERGVPHPKELVPQLVTKGDSAVWNTLTPRTMTKLVLWYRDVENDPIAKATVKAVIRTEFGSGALQAIERSLGMDEKKKAKPMDEVRAFVRQNMATLSRPTNRDEQESRIEVLRELDKDEIDVASLLEKIQKMSGGSAIMDALRRETIDLSITGIGEE